MSEPLHFTASVAQVKTMADGGIRLALDLPENAIDIAAAMMQAKQVGAVLECAVMAVEVMKEKKWREEAS